MYLTRDAILAADDTSYEEVSVPEWGGKVLVRSMTGAERDRFENDSIQQKGTNRQLNFTNIRARLVAKVVVSARLDDGGEPVFSKTDVEALGRKNSAALSRVFDAAMRLSGMTENDIEELTGNLEDGQSEDSGSA